MMSVMSQFDHLADRLRAAEFTVIEADGWLSRDGMDVDEFTVDKVGENQRTNVDVDELCAGDAPLAYVTRGGDIWLLARSLVVVTGGKTKPNASQTAAVEAIRSFVIPEAERPGGDPEGTVES